jgi:VWFA-related protein
MKYAICFLALAFLPLIAEEEVIFRSDVSLVRVDAQVLDYNRRAITGLKMTDFVLREEGQPQEIRNFANENMPVDVLLLLDVSGSMRPHVQRIAEASHQALQALGKDDRIGIMVFDRSARLRMPFRNSRADVEREMEYLLRQETFDGGTDITRALIEAANYVAKSGRRDARRAIVILTDDQTEFNRDDAGVTRALTRADAVLSAILAPDAMGNRPHISQGGGGWPSGGPSIGGPLGGIILGRRRGGYGIPGGGGGGPVIMGSRTRSAGTAEIAQQSGGDSMAVDDASALETTLARIRQRYALYFYLPEGVKPGQERGIDVALSDAARRRYSGAEVRYRRVYLAPGGSTDPVDEGPARVSLPSGRRSGSDEPPVLRRRPVGEVSTGPREGPLNTPAADTSSDSREGPSVVPASNRESGGWRRADPTSTPSPASDDSNQGGWRRVKPGERP